MPLYDYRCTECARVVEVMHGIHDSGPEACQHCGGAMRKALSPPAIHFKGSGWAKKDAAASVRKAKPKPGTTSSPATASDTPSDGAKSSTKEATATEAGSGSAFGSESKAASTAGNKTD